MNKKQFLFLSIGTFVVLLTIGTCLGVSLPDKTIVDKVMHIVLPLCFGFLAGIIVAIINIIFEHTRKDK